MMSGKRWLALGIAAFLFVVAIGFQVLSSVVTTDWENVLGGSDKPFEKVTAKQGTSGQTIAVLELNGVIEDSGQGSVLNSGGYNHDQFISMLQNAGKDKQVDAVIIRVNSPGGGVVESAEIHAQVVDIQDTYDKPVYVSMGNTAASGGYYLAATADKIVAHPATLTGSIGVIMESINVAELADEFGVDVNTIKSGEFKDILSPTREMTEEERDILQTMVDELYDDFVEVIVEGRDMDPQMVRKLGDGRTYTGSQAKDNGLVDETGDLDDTIDMLKADHDLKGASVIEYKSGMNLSQLFNATAGKVLRKDVELTGVVELIRESAGPRPMYLYTE